jgi:TolA-binding protein
MPDLYSRRFELTPRAGVEPFAAFAAAVRDWIGARWPSEHPWFGVADIGSLRASDGSIFRWEPFIDGNRVLIDFSWRHADSTDADQSWSTTVTYVGLPERTSVSIKVTNTFAAPGGEAAKLTTRPRLLLHLLEHFTVRGSEGEVRQICHPLLEADIPFFVRYDLFDPQRPYPILVITPNEDGTYAVDPDQFAREFVSLAKLFRICTPNATFVLTRELGRKELSVFRGAARLYGPKFRADSNPLQHPLVFPKRLADPPGRMALAQVLALATARVGTVDPAIPILRDERAVQADQRRATVLDNLRRQATASVEQWQRIAEDYATANDSLRARIRELEVEVQSLDSKARALQHNLAQRDGTGETPEEPDLVDFGPTTVAEAVELAQELFADQLLILDSALDTAAQSPYRRIDELARVLTVIADVSGRLRQGPLGRSLREEFSGKGVDYRQGIAASSSRRIRDQFRFSQGGRTWVCEEHVALGGATYSPADCLRIYFASSAGEGIVIGHVGRHLDTDRTT